MNIREKDLSNVNKIGIYCITNLLNGKKYIGKTGNKRGIKQRWNIHTSELNNNKSNCIYLQNSWNKYGEDNFEFSILEIIEPIDDITKLNKILNEKEQYWISYYNTYNSDKGYNLTKGGEGVLGLVLSDETKQKMSDSRKQYYINNPNKKLIGEKNPMFGKFGILHHNFRKHKSELSKIKQSNTEKEQYKNGDRTVWCKGLTKETDERVRRISENHKGEKNGMYNIRGKDNILSKPIIQLDLNGKYIKKFDSIKQASNNLNINRTSIINCLKKRHKTAGGFKWKYEQL